MSQILEKFSARVFKHCIAQFELHLHHFEELKLINLLAVKTFRYYIYIILGSNAIFVHNPVRLIHM